MRVTVKVCCEIDDKFLELSPFKDDEATMALREECIKAVSDVIDIPYAEIFFNNDTPERLNQVIKNYGVFTEVEAQKTGWTIIQAM